MSYEASDLYFLNYENKNTTLIFVSGDRLDKIISKHPYISERIDDLHTQCFNSEFSESDFPYADQIIYIFATSIIHFGASDFFENKTNVDTISSMVIMPIITGESRAELWTECSSVNGRTRGFSKLLIESALKNFSYIDTWQLIVDYNSPYWNRAISLYSSLGFQDPQNYKIYNDEFLLLTLSKDNFVKEKTRSESKNFRMSYFLNKNYHVSLLKLPFEHLEVLGMLAEYQRREYAAGIGVKLIESNPKGTAKKYESYGICDFTPGNIIVDKEASARIPIYFYTFHTHPDVATDNNELIVNPPSDVDLMSLLKMTIHGYIKHFVIESGRNGIWSCQVNPNSMKFICGLSDKKFKSLLWRTENLIRNKIYKPFFSELEKLRELSSISQQFANLEFSKNQMINQYLSDINKLTWKDVGVDNNNPIYQIDYFDWEYILKVGYLEDWTMVYPCDIPIKSSSENCLNFGFDYETLEPILDAIDKVGLEECTISNKSFEKSICKDSWKFVNLSEYLKASDSDLAELISEYKTPEDVGLVLSREDMTED